MASDPFMAVQKNSKQTPNWKDNILFYEYFHGDNGAGLGASHQTGWTGLSLCSLETLRYSNDRGCSGRKRNNF